MLKLLPFLLLLVALAGAQTTDPTQTDNFDNGRLWAQLASREKVAWVRGYASGLQMGAFAIADMSVASFKAKGNKFFPYGLKLNYDEISAGVDHFYSETPENRPVPIAHALELVTLKATGAPQSDLDAAEALFRGEANK